MPLAGKGVRGKGRQALVPAQHTETTGAHSSGCSGSVKIFFDVHTLTLKKFSHQIEAGGEWGQQRSHQ